MIETVVPALRVGEPSLAGPLAVYPVFGAPAALEFVAFAEAAAAGAVVGELPEGASVNDLLVRNPLDVGVLLYEGEELRGAQQDRTLDVSVLVPPGAQVRVPVSCVEAGRWESARAGEAFAPAPAHAFPSLRRAKSRAASAGSGRASQHEVWSVVGSAAARHAAVSDTGAMRDVFAARAEVLAEFAARVPRADGQLGAVVAIAGELVVADVVGRPDVWAALHGPLVAGYALDAVERLGGEHVAPPSTPRADRFARAALTCPGVVRPGVGAGEEIRFEGMNARGSRLTCAGGLVALTAFPPDAAAAPRVGRPSRRRR